MIKKPFAQFVKSDYPKGSVIQRYGVFAPIYPTVGLASHNGLDLVNTIGISYGTPICAVEDGIVVEVKDQPTGFGRHIKIISNENEWTYGHLSELNVVLGQRVYGGDIIGKMGNSGSVTSQGIYQWGGANPDKGGTHLHLGLRKFKPLIGTLSLSNSSNIQYSNGMRGTILNLDNGNKGAVDFYDILPDDEEELKKTLLLQIISLYKQIIDILKNKQR